jgi:BirA family biotin operon repressor/biotin-[acetyl-CoA-carboxylase] ligase
MNIIKLNAIGSTNTFLKELVSSRLVENYTVVTAESQTEGKGQMGASWVSEKGKNLLFSIFIKFDSFKALDVFYLNYAVSLAITTALNKYKLPNLSVKWPNDILSQSNKVSGILIENSFRNNELNYAVIGVGINVNQVEFDSSLKQIKSLKSVLGKEIDREKLLADVLFSIKREIENCNEVNFHSIKKRYLEILYKKEIPTMFKDSGNDIFIGKIINVSDSGKLQIELEDTSVREFGIKEIQILKNL